MADDFDNTDEIENLTDDELRTLVRTQLQAHPTFDADDIEVSVRSGSVTISGRVGTEEELRIVDHLLTDVIGLGEIDNQLVVDELRRATSPEAIDEHIADEDAQSGLMLGDASRPYTAESEHLADELDDSESVGTHDINEAIENAQPWIPPEGPTPEGVTGRE